MYFKEYMESDYSSPALEKEYNMFYTHCIAGNLAKKSS